MWCQVVKLSVMIKKIFCSIALLADDSPTLSEKVSYLVKLLLTFAPIAFLMSSFGIWYKDNEQFFSFIIGALFINMIVGIGYHVKGGTFKWSQFFWKNIKMWVVIIIVYIILDMLRLTAGDNLAGETFRIFIQITTLLYPSSKALKNIYILNNKQFPPEFIMEKLYNFEKTGNIKDLMNTEGRNNQNENIE